MQFGVAARILDLVGVVFFGEFQCSNVPHAKAAAIGNESQAGRL
jgi:hypothetical protein